MLLATKEDVMAAESDAIEKLGIEAMNRKYFLSPDEYLIRDLVPTLDFTYAAGPPVLGFFTDEWVFVIATASVWEVHLTETVDDQTLNVFYGVVNESILPSGRILEIKWGIGATGSSQKDWWHLQRMYAEEVWCALAQVAGILYLQKDVIYLSTYARSVGNDYMILLGKCLEKAGKNFMGR